MSTTATSRAVMSPQERTMLEITQAWHDSAAAVTSYEERMSARERACLAANRTYGKTPVLAGVGYTDCSGYLTPGGAEPQMAFHKVPRPCKHGGVIINVAAEDERGALRWPKLRLTDVVLPFNYHTQWEKLSIPAGPDTPLGRFVARFERAVEREVHARAAEWFPGTPAETLSVKGALRDTPAGVVLDAKDSHDPVRWTVAGESTIDLLPLAGHRADVEVSIAGLFFKAGTVSTRWRLLACDDKGPARPNFSDSEYAFVDLQDN